MTTTAAVDPHDTAVVPFRIAVPEESLVDLRDRLRTTRWPDRESVDDWSQGIPMAYVHELCAYWRDVYDWRAREALLNEHAQFRTRISDVVIHFIHARSPHPQARPLIISHGWPGSIVEFQKIIPMLTDPPQFGGDAADAFHVVAPSLPGYGFSERPTRTGWGIDAIADTWATLMTRLGYHRFFAQGGDWGAMITTALGQRHPERVAGIHVNLAMTMPELSDPPTEEEASVMAGLTHYLRWENGYSAIQASRPQTLSYGLADSPVFQAAWIVEKFHGWTDCDGHPENIASRDELLDNVMLYWLTATGGSSGRLYWESFNDINFEPVNVPSGITQSPKEVVRTTRAWAEKRFTDLRFFNELPRGGHFAAVEQPEALARDIRACLQTMTL